MKAVEHDGVWWNPNEPDKQRVGRFRFDRVESGRLNLIVPAEKPDFSPELASYDRLFGLTTEGKPITLIHCHERSTRGTFGRTPRPIEVFANQAIVGSHCSSDDPSVSSVSVRFRHLNEWYGRSGVKSDGATQPSDFRARYSAPAPVVLRDADNIQVSLRSVLSGGIRAHRAQIREQMHIEVSATTPRPLSELRRIAHACGDLLSIACLDFCDVPTLTLRFPEAEGNGAHLATFHAVPIYKDRSIKRLRPSDALFLYGDIEDRAPAIFNAWLSQIENLHAARVLYFAGAYGGGFLETKLLLLTQAVEAFHRRFHPPGLFIAPDSFESDVLKPLTSAIPASLEQSFRQSLKTRLKFANELSLRRRMNDLVKDHSTVLQVLVERPTDWVGPIVDHRNEFTHFPIPTSGADLSTREPERLLRYNFFLKLLLESSFMRAMGLSTDDISQIVQGSEKYRQLSVRFFKPVAGGGTTQQPI